MPEFVPPEYVAPVPETPPAPVPDITPPVGPTAAEVAEALKADAEFVASLKGEPGPPGEAGASGIDGLPGEPGAPGSPAGVQSIDADALAVKIAELLKQDAGFVASATGPAGADGAAGPDGAPGKPGVAGPPGEIANIDADAMAAKIAELLKSDVEFIATVTGPTGADGLPGRDGQDGQPGQDGGGRLTRIHVDATGRIYATYDDQTQEAVGDMPFLRDRPAYFDISPRKPRS